jgi:predicted dehydrogenase
MNAPSTLKLGLVGLDTSHVTAFTQLLHDASSPHHVPGARVVSALPGGSPDFPLSFSRVESFTRQLRDEYGVRIATSLEEVGEACDGILIESVDGRAHRAQFKTLLAYGKPLFVDKPLAGSMEDAEAMAALAEEKGVPVMSCSSLRFAEAFRHALRTPDVGALAGLDLHGPMPTEPQLPGLFWYGVHTAEMMIAALGRDFGAVRALHTDGQDVVVAEWSGGRLGVLRGKRGENTRFGGQLHFERDSVSFRVDPAKDRPFYASLLAEMIPFFQGKQNAAPIDEALAVMRYMDAANRALGYA